MSIEATAWALNVETVPDSTARVILLGLANHAGRDGSAAWPSVATLAAYAVCSDRTVQRKLRDLEARGLLRRGDQRLVNHLPADRRPTVYDLPIGATICHPVTEDGVTPVTERGDTTGRHGVTPMSPKPSMNHPEPSNPPNPPTGGGQGELIPAEPVEEKRPAAAVYPDAFEAVWAAWPKRRTDTAGKKAAHASWTRAVHGTAKRPARVTAAELQEAVERLAADPNLPPEQYQPNLTTWLNQDRWLNGPYAPRGGSGNRPQAGDTHRAMQRSYSAAEKYRQLEEADGPARGPHLLERKTA